MPDLSFAQRIATVFGYLHKTLHVEVSRHAITIRQRTGVLRKTDVALHQQTLTAEDFSNPRALIATLRLALTAVARRHMNIVITLDDALTRMWIVTPPGNATSLDDCRAAAGLRFHALFGESISEWEIVADWDASKPFLASALPRALLQNLLALCAEFDLNIQRLEPQFVSHWNGARDKLNHDSWLAVVHNDTLTLGAARDGRLVSVRNTGAPADLRQPRSWLDQQIQREALLLNLALPSTLLVQGTMPHQWQKNDAGTFQCRPLLPESGVRS